MRPRRIKGRNRRRHRLPGKESGRGHGPQGRAPEAGGLCAYLPELWHGQEVIPEPLAQDANVPAKKKKRAVVPGGHVEHVRVAVAPPKHVLKT